MGCDCRKLARSMLSISWNGSATKRKGRETGRKGEWEGEREREKRTNRFLIFFLKEKDEEKTPPSS